MLARNVFKLVQDVRECMYNVITLYEEIKIYTHIHTRTHKHAHTHARTHTLLQNFAFSFSSLVFSFCLFYLCTDLFFFWGGGWKQLTGLRSFVIFWKNLLFCDQYKPLDLTRKLKGANPAKQTWSWGCSKLSFCQNLDENSLTDYNLNTLDFSWKHSGDKK